MVKRRLIVNADDFGLTDGVNRAIGDGHRLGIVTSATLMANGPAFDSAITLIGDLPRLGVGIHLNLIEGPPVGASASVSSLLGRGGELQNAPSSLGLGIAMGRVRMDDIECELRAQIEKVQGAGVRVTHLDGHKHVHLMPRIFEVVVRLAVEYGIRGLRCAVETRPRVFATMRANRARWIEVGAQQSAARALSLLALTNRRKACRAGLASPARILGITQTGLLCPEILERLFHSLRAAPAELICHPGYVDDELMRQTTRLRESRQRELVVLTSERTRDIINREEIELITYGDLVEAI